MNGSYHTSVLLQELIELLNVQSGKKYIDATLGGGGHTGEILKRGGKVLGIDSDQEALDYVKENFQFSIFNFQLKLVKGNFREIEKIAKENRFDKVSGILFDLGVSGHQFDTPERGFSFQKQGPLDMRMDTSLKIKAKDLVNILTKGELYELFTKLGEERFARAITNSIISARRIRPISTTGELSEIIGHSVPGKIKIEAEARIFQALRIAINDELHSLKIALPQAFNLLEKEGKIAVISFHSLEDRIVKKQFIEWEEKGKGLILTKKPIRPSIEEVEKNSRSRSAKLRAFEKK
ncbi:16S rRNA (cytosine(1402)-N(4))-methyltransferase RsmH [Patescibacteria group bacterium]|nr:16S rRNA (cytosine(1402)-N(4))-methyltransferase RsmH [Patescibacteria group bacterium]